MRPNASRIVVGTGIKGEKGEITAALLVWQRHFVSPPQRETPHHRYTPPGGRVTQLTAGFLARGSAPDTSPSQSPQWH